MKLWLISRMWHESRRQEKIVKGMIIDYQKRAERRKDHYEKMKSDPLQLLRLTGTTSKLYLNPSVSSNEYSVLVPWQGDNDVMISRFDVRAHLDYIPELSRESPLKTEFESSCDYERYRQVIYNKFKGISQERALAEINIEESYPVSKPIHSEKKSSNKTAAIGYQYDKAVQADATKPIENQESGEDTCSDDVLSDIGNELDLNSLDKKQLESLDEIAGQFGLLTKEFCLYHRHDIAEHKLLKEELFLEKQKALTKNKGSTRKERRALKLELKSKQPEVAYRPNSPLSYACRQSPTYPPRYRAKSDSSSSEEPGKIEYITEFGSVPRLELRHKKKSPKRSYSSLRHRRSRSRDRHHEKYRRHRRHSSSRSRSNSRSRERHSKHTRDRSRSSDSVSEAEKRDISPVSLKKIDKVDEQSKLTHFEKMQQRMQNKISKQLKQDQKAEQAKLRAKVAVQEDRENDIRGQMKRWRDKERERLGEDENFY